ncbi:MAG: hypothetical protein A3F67_10660 [Verrucomicrobia bacterium RIFCSPHIGHO2_12_FULL_41_10]|nr:MAG: hypothetical protein A3F67_10660 [Verrucomicrobia bacterium RIFCSPHIGHO2_12_FULL_41_10]HLB34667.1 DUF4410 domain-containing protein [Chthoniobacterales bacterium]
MSTPPSFLSSYRWTILLFVFLLGGCASVSVKNTESGNTSPQELPERIYVKKFAAPIIHFHVHRKGKSLCALVQQERRNLADDLLKRLRKHIAPTYILAKGEIPPQGNYWLITGSFELVNEGSRLLRAGIGCGLGKTMMETTTQVIDLSGKSTEPLLVITTTGGSGMAPGAVAALAPIGPFVLSNTLINASGPIGGALGSGISIDRRRTSREIVAAISEYSVQHGLIPKKKGLHPKRLGKIPELF